MNPFLNLEIDLDLAAHDLRALIDGRIAIREELDKLGGPDWEPKPADETRFDGLLKRFELIGPEVERREAVQVERREARQRVHAQTQTRNRPGTPAPPRGPEADEEEDILSLESLQNYSLMRGLRQLVEGNINGFEAEVQQELELRRGQPANGLLIPWNLPNMRSRESRTVGATNAASLIPTITATTMIDVLRNAMAMVSMGAQVMDNMIGNFEIPKKTATSSSYWVAEATAPTASTPTTGQVAFSPETIGTYVDITRRLLKQTSFAAEAMVRDDIFQAISLGLDLAGVNGSGSSNQPEGILQNSSVPTVAIGTDGGALDWDTVVDMETEVADDNADIGSLGYLVTPKVRGQAKRTAVFSGVGRTIWALDNTMNGYKAQATKQLPDNLSKGASSGILSAALFGNFADAVYALWGGIDIVADVSTLSTTGGVRLVGLADADFQLRRAESFAKCIDINSAL